MANDAVKSDNALNRGPLTNIINWILLVTMLLAVLMKVLTKWVLIRNFQYDDAFSILSMLFAAATGIAINYKVSAGLGQHQWTLSDDQMISYQKALYTSQFMYVLMIAFANQTVLQLFSNLVRNGARVKAVYAASGVNALFTVVMLFCIAFQCPLPHPWEVETARCFDQAALLKAFEGLDIAIIIVIALLAGFIFHDLQMAIAIKIPIVIAFSAQIFLIPLLAFRLHYALQKSHSSDHSFDSFLPTILTLICTYGSVVIACVPFLKPVLKGIQSGVMTGDIRSLATLGSSQYLFSKASGEKMGSTLSRNRYGMKKLEDRADSQDQIITHTREVQVDFDQPEPVLLKGSAV